MTDTTTASFAPRHAYLALWLPRIEAVVIPLAALISGLLVFSLFLLALGKSPVEFYSLIYKAGFSSGFSWKNTLSRVAPLLFAALCVALPARLGLVVIGGEGAIVLGGLAAGITGAMLIGAPAGIAMLMMVLMSALVGALWIGGVGWMRVKRGVNETIASLLMAYIGIALLNHFVEGPFRDPASLNKPSTAQLPDALRVGDMPIGIEVHWGFGAGVVACILCWFILDKTTIGFAARITGQNIRAAQVQALPVGRLIIGFTAAGGALAALAGFFEVSAIHGAANGSLIAGYGYTGILISFLARHNPLAIIPVAILLAGFEASSGLIQRRMDLPDATILVLQGIVFVILLLSETLYGRLAIFRPSYWRV
ncbi:Ribose ABC transport system, permease protein RbsC [Candidatus Rhodobacter oscarellae]|uniref:Ribose ABC transport system, permease protein RbsC n=1 Tax=Candidatus Rhodobacter oscarellae TaxID=1675527 RepID=A0A0J9EAZ9_9RHOB|nr:ABC transporter permease [Candidatus Rhodobacter lobularis]KMW59960.1 Ribose ABC transport system, permease protein RbsC [Candidatus Rhodobacter lobularis]